MTNTLRGSELCADDRAHVLAAYIYRMTTEARRRWPDASAYMLRNGYRMPERSDAEWLERTRFRVTKAGRLDKRARHCETSY